MSKELDMYLNKLKSNSDEDISELGHQLSDVFDDASGGKMSKDEVEEVVSDLRTLLKTSSSKDKVLAASLLESAVVLILAVV